MNTATPIRTLKSPLPLSTWLLRISFAAAALLATLFTALAIFEITYGNRILPGARVWEADVSGLTLAEAERALAQRFTYVNDPILTLQAFGQTWPVAPSALGVRIDLAATARAAYALGRGDSALSALSTQLDMLSNGAVIPPVIALDPAAAAAYLEARAAELNLEPRDANVSLDGLTVMVTPAQNGRTLDVAATLALLSNAARALQPATVDLVFVDRPAQIVDVSAATQQLQTLISQPFTLYLEHPRPTDSVASWDMTLEQLAGLARVTPAADGTSLAVTLARDELAADLTDLANQIKVEPTNARFVFNDDTRELEVVAPSADGRELDADATLAAIETAITRGEHRAPIAVKEMLAEFKEGVTAASLGITENVVTAQTFFAGSAAARAQNIAVAASKLHGVIVKPGEVFSFGQYLGDVSLNDGYAEALIIANGRTVQGVGGGVCQVSTTAFRAAFLGGYPIIERWPHAYRVGWYERGFGPGLDATVFVPEVDFKFKNDSPYHLLIETYVNTTAGRLTFKFYSTGDGRQVSVSEPLVENVKPHGPDILEEDPTLPEGERKQVDYAVDGADVTVRRTVMRAGAVVSEDVVFTRYLPWQAVYKVGTGPVAGN
ncbi:MAG TPA: VanW family protein [Anaerolineae bacterium]|nr:VanW family protein [Anaerolineae bacterium]